MKALSFILLFSFHSAWARISDDNVHLSVQGTKVIGAIDKGYHFNAEAPAELQSMDGKISVAPEKKAEKQIIFDTAKLEGQPFTLSYYVCDDAKTVCEQHGGQFQIAAGELKSLGIDKAMPAAAALVPAPGKIPRVLPKKKEFQAEVNDHGFIENDLEAGLKQAAKQKKKVLVDFRAPWCPACIRLETEVFGQKIFQEATANVVKVSLNVDLNSNKALADQYSAKAIPVLVLMDAKGQELYRSLDFKPADVLVAELKSAIKNEKTSYAQLKKVADKEDKKAILELGRREFKAMNFEEAFKWLAKTNDEPLMRANAEVSMWSERVEKDEKQSAGYMEVLKRSIALFPDSFESITWRNEWAKKSNEGKSALAPEVKDVLRTNSQKISNLLSDEKARTKTFKDTQLGDYSRFEKSELLSQNVDNISLLSPSDEKKSKADLAAEVKKMDLSVDRPGEMLMALSYLDQADEKKTVVEGYEKLIRSHPGAYVYYRRLARFYLKEKDFSKALPPAQKTVELGTDLPLQHLELLAKVQKGLAQKTEAKNTVAKALALPEARIERNQKTVKSLEELSKTL
jgi:thioredoxin-like negative regulator of GroEL